MFIPEFHYIRKGYGTVFSIDYKGKKIPVATKYHVQCGPQNVVEVEQMWDILNNLMDTLKKGVSTSREN